MIRKFIQSDIPALVELDRRSYGLYGADEKYFLDKLSSPHTTILIFEENEKIIGFSVFEINSKNGEQKDFKDLVTKHPLKDRWMHLIAFTTISNYGNFINYSKLLIESEKTAHEQGSSIYCVPLSINHPYPKAFSFFKKNGYKKEGTVKWIAHDGKNIDCLFFRKNFRK